MSQSESERRAAEAKARSKAQPAAGRRPLSDAELAVVAAAGDKDGDKGSGTPGKKTG